MPRGEQALEGYRRALDRHGMRFEPRLVRVAAPGKAKSGRQDQARDTARALLAVPDWPSAAVVCGAGLALGMIGAMAVAGIACPTGISIVALGDGDWAGQTSPALTAVGEPAREIGAEAVRLLLDRLKNGTGPTAGRVLVPGALVLRASTAPPGAAG
jgi:LacI family transcriptional regulator